MPGQRSDRGLQIHPARHAQMTEQLQLPAAPCGAQLETQILSAARHTNEPCARQRSSELGPRSRAEYSGSTNFNAANNSVFQSRLKMTQEDLDFGQLGHPGDYP